MTLRVGSLFSGVGGFELGFDAAGFETAWQVEIDASARSVLARHWPTVARFTDVREVGAHCLEPVDVITFGSPCQDLSVAGKRAGLEGARSSLFHEAVRIIRELRPEWAVWENVPGAFSSNGGRDFGAVLDALADAGALDICWRVLDAQWFGVPQRRRRVFVVADFGGQRTAQVLFESEGGPRHPAPRRAAGKDLAATSRGSAAVARAVGVIKGAAIGRKPENGPQRGEWLDDGTCFTLNCVETHAVALHTASALTASAGHHGHSSPRGDGNDNLVVARALTTRQERYDLESQDEILAFDWTQSGAPSATVPTLRVGTGLGIPSSPAIYDATQITSRANGSRPQPGDPCHPLAATAHPPRAVGGMVRRLTPRECERLMGWPDDWTRYRPDGSELSDSARYRLIGNGVVAPVSAWIARRLMAAHHSTVGSDGAASSVSARTKTACRGERPRQATTEENRSS